MRIFTGFIAALILAASMLAGCASPEPVAGGPPAPTTTGQALAQMACPNRIAEAYAWVNHMPGPSRPAGMLNVTVKFVGAPVAAAPAGK